MSPPLRALSAAFQFSLPLFRGVAEAALYCAHRTIYMLPPILLVMSLGMGADWSSTARVQRVPLFLPLFREWPRLPSTARIGRAQFHRPLFCEQDGHLATPSPARGHFQHPAS